MKSNGKRKVYMNKNYENVKKWRKENKEKFKEQQKR